MLRGSYSRTLLSRALHESFMRPRLDQDGWIGFWALKDSSGFDLHCSSAGFRGSRLVI